MHLNVVFCQEMLFQENSQLLTHHGKVYSENYGGSENIGKHVTAPTRSWVRTQICVLFCIYNSITTALITMTACSGQACYKTKIFQGRKSYRSMISSWKDEIWNISWCTLDCFTKYLLLTMILLTMTTGWNIEVVINSEWIRTGKRWRGVRGSNGRNGRGVRHCRLRVRLEVAQSCRRRTGE